MKPVKARVKKRFQESLSVRSYLVEQAQKEGRDLLVIYDDQQYTIPWKFLGKGKRVTAQTFTSQFDGKPYHLVDFRMKEIMAAVQEENQPKLF